MISYEDYRKRVFEVAMKTSFKELSEKEVLEYFQRDEEYIRDMYEADTNEERYKNLYGDKPDFEYRLIKFKNGAFLESGIHGTVHGLSMMFE